MDEGIRLLFFRFFFFLNFFSLTSCKSTQCVFGDDTFIDYREIVDLEALSIDQLETILRTRGFHGEYSEKWQMVEQAEMTGMVVEEDLVEDLDNSTYEPKYILEESDLNLRFDNLNESFWLVRILQPNSRNSRKEAIWSSIEQMMAPLGVWAGTLECSEQSISGLCSKWTVEGMGLALLAPSDYHRRAMYHTAFPKSKGALLRWMTEELDNLESLKHSVAESWIQDTAFQVLYITNTSAKPPLFFTMLAARFNHWPHTQFGYLTNFKGSSMRGMKIPRFPAYVVSASGQQHLFGSRLGERLSFRSMESYLLSIQPSSVRVLLGLCETVFPLIVLSTVVCREYYMFLIVLLVLALLLKILAWIYWLAMFGSVRFIQAPGFWQASFLTGIFFVGHLYFNIFRNTQPRSDITLPSSHFRSPAQSESLHRNRRTASRATQGIRVSNINQSCLASVNQSPPPSQVEHEPTPSTSQADSLQMLDASFTHLMHAGGPSPSVERRHMIITHRFIKRYIAEVLQDTGELSCMQDLKVWTCVRHCPGCSGLEETGDCSCQRGAKGGYCADITVRGRWEASAVEPDGVDFSIAECAICLFDFSYKDTLCTFPCRHTFHWSGIHRWLVNRSNQLRCPMCRQPCGDL